MINATPLIFIYLLGQVLLAILFSLKKFNHHNRTTEFSADVRERITKYKTILAKVTLTT